MENNFVAALEMSMDAEFSWIDSFDYKNETHDFPADFKSRIANVSRYAEYSYVSIGSRRMRKGFVAILVALLALAIAGCSYAAYCLIEWNEEQHDETGTLGVTFEITGEPENTSNELLKPVTPLGYEIIRETSDHDLYFKVEYSDSKGNIINYFQENGIESLGLEIDNDDHTFKEISVNGYKGYSREDEYEADIIWTDGYHLFTLQGTCSMDILVSMAESIGE